ncbi:hypothetical protein [Fluviicola chungangensis]|uniref:Tetratricopeptide repeat protein n=1 Tax=Fluviicola chungangensis TaxID=2597671 RepID=A0A556N6M4_9FLAO|nr:hypothetical protein [Fluviicola chungangensis]TSJ47723.1 hypothetical protein FO442_00930 [Fluviicola chungangensis]
MKNHLFLLFLAFYSLNFAQSDYFFEKYVNDYQKQVLNDVNASHFELFMISDSACSGQKTAAAKKEFDAFISELKASKILKQSEEKTIRALHKQVHERFLTRYRALVDFDEIFVTGEYNCVSSTALFALVLEELGIPYYVQEQPGHVLIMAYPNTSNITVEMTTVKNAFVIPPRKDINRAIENLLELQLVTPKQVNTLGSVAVYDLFFNVRSKLTIDQLIGIQLFNHAITAVNNDQTEKALSDISKAERFYDVYRTQILKSELLLDLVEKKDFKSLASLPYLFEFGNRNKYKNEYVIYSYANFINQRLIADGNRPMADSSLVLVNRMVKDTNLLNDLTGIYYLGMADYFSKARKNEKALEYSEMAYRSSPNNSFVKSALLDQITYHLSVKYLYDEEYSEEDEGPDEEELDEELETAEKFYSEINKYCVKYPYLDSNNRFILLKLYANIDFSMNYYKENDGVNGKKYFDLSESLIDRITDKELIDEDYLGWLYAECATYLFRQHQYEEAVQTIEKGLKIDPEHERLLKRLEIIKSRMK